ncbi:MAG: hypothetical protein LUC34_02235 [Campylobacter sp.]|nr:hypothetical protein [Campylobacter sp.]
MESVDYDFMKKCEKEMEISASCDEYERELSDLFMPVFEEMKIIRARYEPEIGFENADEIEGLIWGERF